jgi:hypothetical protein
MRVADRCLALLMKITCRVETGDYNRNLQRQARTTPAGFFRLSKSAHPFCYGRSGKRLM